MKKNKFISIDDALSKMPKELRENKLAFRDIVNEVTFVKKNHSTIPLSLEDLSVLKEWAREYEIFIRAHKSGHGNPEDCSYRKPHIHIDITGKGWHNKVHYLVDVTT